MKAISSRGKSVADITAALALCRVDGFVPLFACDRIKATDGEINVKCETDEGTRFAVIL
jgi:hypothetical protein